MRTNVVLDDKLIETALQYTGLKTKKELIDYALRELVKRQKQKAVLQLAGMDTMRIIEFFERQMKRKKSARSPRCWDGKAAERITRVLDQALTQRRQSHGEEQKVHLTAAFRLRPQTLFQINLDYVTILSSRNEYI